MILGERRSLIQALASWGRHEAVTRGRYSADALNDALALEYALRSRAQWIAPILAAQPIEVLAVRVEPSDVATFTLFRVGTVQQWKAAVAREPESDSYRGFRKLVDASEPVRGPLICVVPSTANSMRIIFEGYHRCGAWSEHIARGDTYDVEGFVIFTERAP